MKDFTLKDAEELILSGAGIGKDQAEALTSHSYAELASCADRIRKHFCGDKIVLCSIINAKSGRCPEDCRYCAQSSHYAADTDEYPLMEYNSILSQALEMRSYGIHRFSIVTSGRTLSDGEFGSICSIVERLVNDTGMTICASLGFMTAERSLRLKESGLSLYHHNLETNSSFFNNICSTHSHSEKLETIRNIRSAGIALCIGGIIGLGESWKDRIDFAFEIMEQNPSSVPINILSPIKGTPLYGIERITPGDIIKTTALFRLIMPRTNIRYAGGRSNLGELHETGIRCGINGLMLGNFLTTPGKNIKDDIILIENSGFLK